MLGLACKSAVVSLLDKAGWIIREILYTFFQKIRINLWYLSKNETFCHAICFKITRPSKHFENIIKFKIKTGCYPALLTPKIMKLLKNKHCKNVLHITEIVLLHCNVVTNDFQHDSKVLYIYLLPTNHFIDYSTFHLKKVKEFSYTEVWFTDQYSKPLEIEDKINIPSVIN